LWPGCAQANVEYETWEAFDTEHLLAAHRIDQNVTIQRDLLRQIKLVTRIELTLRDNRAVLNGMYALILKEVTAGKTFVQSEQTGDEDEEDEDEDMKVVEKIDKSVGSDEAESVVVTVVEKSDKAVGRDTAEELVDTLDNEIAVEIVMDRSDKAVGRDATETVIEVGVQCEAAERQDQGTQVDQQVLESCSSIATSGWSSSTTVNQTFNTSYVEVISSVEATSAGIYLIFLDWDIFKHRGIKVDFFHTKNKQN
jgi:phosphoribosylanthranilate isomerase